MRRPLKSPRNLRPSWIGGDPRSSLARSMGALAAIFGAVALVACSGGSGGSNGGDDPGSAGGGVGGGAGGGGGQQIGGNPVTGDGGTPDDPCIGVQCSAGNVCSAGTCVPDTTDADHDGFTVVNDCDDKNADVHPGAIEACNGKDDNCDKQIDEGFDQDNDGYFQCAHTGKVADCNDHNAAINDPTKPAFPTTSDIFGTVNPHWVTAGGADINTSVQGWSRLTDSAANLTGGLFWNAPYKFDHFQMSADFFIQGVTTGGEGLAFVWTSSTTNAVGGAGAGIGFKGLGGYAVVIDTTQETGEPAAPFLAIEKSDGTRLVTVAPPTLPNLRDSQTHTLKVALQAGKVSVAVDTKNYITDFALPSYTAFTGHWGFTAATGATGETHFVNNISMSFPDGQACVQ